MCAHTYRCHRNCCRRRLRRYCFAVCMRAGVLYKCTECMHWHCVANNIYESNGCSLRTHIYESICLWPMADVCMSNGFDWSLVVAAGFQFALYCLLLSVFLFFFVQSLKVNGSQAIKRSFSQKISQTKLYLFVTHVDHIRTIKRAIYILFHFQSVIQF